MAIVAAGGWQMLALPIEAVWEAEVTACSGQ